MTMKRCSRILAWLLTFIMAFNMMPVTGLAADEEVDGYVNIGETEDTVNLTKSNDPLGISGKSGALVIYEKNKHIALMTTRHSTSGRLNAKEVSITDGRILTRGNNAPSVWTITYDGSKERYNLKSGNQYLNLSNGARMADAPYPVKIENIDGKLRLLETDGKTSVNLKSHDINQGFQASNWTTSQGNEIQDNERFEIIPVEIDDQVTVQFDCKGAPENIASVKKNVGEKITLPAYESDYIGHELSGWKTNGDSKLYEVGEEYTLPDKMSITFNAVWENRQTVTFDANGGDAPAPSAITIKKDVTSIELPGYTGSKDGYEFSGWSRTSNPYTAAGSAYTIYSPGDAYPVEEKNNKLYAVWRYIGEVTVQFNCNGAPGSIQPIEGNVGEQITLPNYEDDYIGRELVGWKISGDNTVYGIGDKYTLPAKESITFTAVWEGRQKVTFDANGGSDPAPSAITIKKGVQSIKLPAYTGTKEGYQSLMPHQLPRLIISMLREKNTQSGKITTNCMQYGVTKAKLQLNSEYA